MAHWARRLTAAGSGGVAVIAIEGAQAEERLDSLFSADLPRRGEIAFGILRDPDGGDVLDEVLVVRADRLELHMHGAPALARDVLERLGGNHDPGPQTIEERARALAPHAPTLLGARVLIDQSEGSLRRAIEEIRGDAAAGDERGARRGSLELARRGRAAERLWTRSVVALTGPVNAGKSTLFNVLLGEENALVSDVPGTTRDVLAGHAQIGIWPVIVLDTAGVRDIGGARQDLSNAKDRDQLTIEARGIEHAAAAAARADVVFHLGATAKGEVGGAGVHFRTRCAEDLGGDPGDWPEFGISALESPEHARAVCAQGFRAQLELPRSATDLWTPGAAIPFERSMIESLESIAAGKGDTSGALDALLRAR